jgi:hypothetical protein
MGMPSKPPHLSTLEAQQTQRRLSREELLTPRIRKGTITLKAFDGAELEVQTLSNRQRQTLRAQARNDMGELDEDKWRLLMMCEMVVDPELSVEDLESLNGQDAAIVDELELQLTMFSMMGSVDELGKESKETPSSGSDSSSPNGSG